MRGGDPGRHFFTFCSPGTFSGEFLCRRPAPFEVRAVKDFVGLLFALLLTLDCSAAPAPLARRHPPELTPGRWVMTWNGTRYDVTLDKSGLYRASDGAGSNWVGHWRYCPRTRTLCIDERVETSASMAHSCYRVTLEGLEGRGVVRVHFRRAEE